MVRHSQATCSAVTRSGSLAADEAPSVATAWFGWQQHVGESDWLDEEISLSPRATSCHGKRVREADVRKIAHGFSRGKGDGTREALEGRYKRRLLLTDRRPMSRGFTAGGPKFFAKAVSPLSGLQGDYRHVPTAEAVGYDLPAPPGRNPRRAFSLGRRLGPRPLITESEHRRGPSQCRKRRRAWHGRPVHSPKRDP